MNTELKNFTPFANMMFANLDNQGREFGILMVKTTWDIQKDGTCLISEEQEPFALTDEFHGEINSSSVRYPSDLVPYKPSTDFILNATAFAPDIWSTDSWDVAVHIQDDVTQKILVDRTLKVTGPRMWQRRLGKWWLSDPDSIEKLDIRYEYAYGGLLPKGEDDEGQPIIEAYEFNPVGRGYVERGWANRSKSIPAPQILFPAQKLSSPYTPLEPAGFGPVQAAWLPRRPLGGTYDDHWMENVWPNWPQDYQFSFHNAAPNGMQNALPLGSGIHVTLMNLHPENKKWKIHVPNPRLGVVMTAGGKVITYGMNVDSVFLDIAEDRLDDPRIFVMSRLVFDHTVTDAMALVRLGESDDLSTLKVPPTPGQVSKFIEETVEEVPA